MVTIVGLMAKKAKKEMAKTERIRLV